MTRFGQVYSKSLPPREQADDASCRVLAVGCPKDWQQQEHGPVTDDFSFVEFSEVNQGLLNQIRPQLVAVPLLARGFDCVDLAMLLHGLGFSGEVRAVAVGLPNPELIEREVRTLCPQLNFRVVEEL